MGLLVIIMIVVYYGVVHINIIIEAVQVCIIYGPWYVNQLIEFVLVILVLLFNQLLEVIHVAKIHLFVI